MSDAERLGADRVEGPLKGYHHEAYAVRLDQGSPLAGEFRWLKLREPRPGVFWYDMRRFASEDQLLELLHGRVPRVPRVSGYGRGRDRVRFLAFIEGVTMDRLPEAAGRVADRYLDQIEELFAALAAVDVASLGHEDLLDCGYRPPSTCNRSAAFLRRLVHFSTAHAYSNAPLRAMGGLLADLGLQGEPLIEFEKSLPDLADRAPRLVHGDLHRKNFVVDRGGLLWTIDWELALVGDPLYDLATHLHLMGYAPDQEQDVIRRWRRAVGEPAATTNADLPHYLTFKRLQSVFTDVVRSSALLQLDGCEGGRLRSAAARVHRSLTAARAPLCMDKVPPLPAVEAALQAWCRTHPAPLQPDGAHCAGRDRGPAPAVAHRTRSGQGSPGR
jgi:aminoglycoside phosphotransferase (APT) family kinase protein